MRLQRFLIHFAGGVLLAGNALIDRDHMEMQVEHRLARRLLVELDELDAVGIERFLRRARDLRDDGDRLRQRIVRGIEHIAARRLRDDQAMALRLRHDVHDDHGVVILVNLDRRDLAPDHLGEDVAVVIGGHERVPSAFLWGGRVGGRAAFSMRRGAEISASEIGVINRSQSITFSR